MGAAHTSADPPSEDAGRSGTLPTRLASMERMIWKALGGWLFRRPLSVPPGGRTFGYAKEAAPLLWGFIAVSALEIPLLDLLLPNWTLRIVFGVIGLWGLIWMCGLLAVQYRMPHVIGPDWARVRAGWSLDVLIPWDVVDVVRPHGHLVTSSRAVQFDEAGTGTPRARVLIAPVASRTNVVMHLRQPLEIEIAGRGQVVTTVRLWADDPAGFVGAATARLLHPVDGER